MSKIAVVYWSGTGNTEAMASAVAEGAKELPQLLAGNKPRAQKTADVGKRQRKCLDLLHTTPHVEFALPI